MIGLYFFIVFTVTSADTVSYLNEDGNGVIVKFEGNPYDPFYWINKRVAEKCKAYPTTRETKSCGLYGSGVAGCHSWVTSFSVYSISDINNTSCGDQDTTACIYKVVTDNLCAYSFWKDPVIMGFCILIFIVIIIAVSVYIYQCLKARRASRNFYYPSDYHL
jgi:hypothetical protein